MLATGKVAPRRARHARLRLRVAPRGCGARLPYAARVGPRIAWAMGRRCLRRGPPRLRCSRPLPMVGHSTMEPLDCAERSHLTRGLRNPIGIYTHKY